MSNKLICKKCKASKPDDWICQCRNIERPTETIDDLSRLLGEIERFDFKLGTNHDEFIALLNQFDQRKQRPAIADLISWIEYLENQQDASTTNRAN